MYKMSGGLARPSPGGVLATVAVGQLMVSLDVSVVNVALPTIQERLGFSTPALSWVVNAYALFFGGLLLLGGRAGDRFGRRPVLFLGLVLFGLASLAGGLAQTPGQLIAMRAAQGVGAALIAPAVLAVLSTSFPAGPARARALSLYSAVTAGGAAVGVVVGGLLTEYAGWRWVMLVNVPIVLLGIVLTARYVATADAGDRSHRLDVVGAVLATAGTMLLVFALVRTETEPWGSVTVLVPLVASVVLLTGFFRYEGRHAREPLLRLGVLKNRSVAGSNVYMMIISITLFTGFYFTSLYLQQVLGLGALPAGLGFLPLCFGLVAGSVLAVPLLRRFGPRPLLIVGGLIGAAGLFWYTALSPDGSFWGDVFGPSLLTSIGIGPLLVPIAHAATAGVPPREAGMVSGLLNSARQVGGSIGLAAMSTIAAAAALDTGTTRERLTAGYSAVFLVNAVLLLVAAFVALTVLPKGAPPPPPRQPSPATPAPGAADAVTTPADTGPGGPDGPGRGTG